MEEWEEFKSDINFPLLYQSTQCNTSFKAKLLAKGLLTLEEEQKLTALRTNEGNIRASKELYGLLGTRIGSYTGVMEVLQEERQTGAWNIPNNASSRKQLEKKESELQHQAGILERATIKINERVLPIQDAFPSLERTKALEILNDPERAKEFLNLNIIGPAYINLDAEIPKQRKLYIPRSISNRLLLDAKVFAIKRRDIFVFKGVDRGELANLVKPNVVRSSSRQRRLITSQHIYLEKDEDWDEMEAATYEPMHLVYIENGDYVLQRSTEITDTILQHSSNKGRESHAYVTEDEFIEQLSSQKDFKGALLCDIPGMGKTWLMESLANKLRCRHEHAFVFFVQLSELSQYLQKSNESSDAFSFTLDFVCGSRLSSYLLIHHANIKSRQVYFFLDGFDEIRDNQVKNTTSFLIQLNENPHVRLVISSRPHMRRHLEQTFKLISYDILPFGRDNQVNAIASHWEEAEIQSLRSELERIAVECIVSMKSIQHDEGHDILGIPLKCYLLAVVYEDYVRNVSSTSQGHYQQSTKKTPIKSIRILYDRFVAAALKKVCGTQPTETFKQHMLNFHTFKALQLLFPDVAQNYAISNSLFVNKMSPADILRAGIICLNSRSKYDFVHRTLAEYFAGKFFAEFWMDVSKYDMDSMGRFIVYFLECTLQTTETVTVNDPFNHNILWTLPKPFRLTNEKLYSFANLTVLWFQENILREAAGRDQVAVSIQQLKQAKLPGHIVLHLQQILNDKSYDFCAACIEEGFTSLLYLVAKLYHAFMEQKQLHEMLTSIYCSSPEKSVAQILCYTAMKGRPETTDELIRLFDEPKQNFLLEFCQNFPLEFFSPLDIAIRQNDIDTFTYFITKLSLPWERLILTCFTGGKLQLADVEVRVQMFETVSLNGIQTLSRLTSQSVKEHLQKLSPNEDLNRWSWIDLTTEYNIAMNGLPHQNKASVLNLALEELDDELFCKLLIRFFGKSSNGADKFRHSTHSMNVIGPQDNEKIDVQTCDVMLECIDLNDAREIFAEVSLNWNSLRKFQNVETLKILIKLLPDAAKHHPYGMSYLHYAVNYGNAEWVKHLIALHDVSIQDKGGSSPLLYLSATRTVEITRLLVDNGADINSNNQQKHNVAHCLLLKCGYTDINDVTEWVNYTLKKGFNRLWNMEDSRGETPLKPLIQLLGIKHPTVQSVLSQYDNLRMLPNGSKLTLIQHSLENDDDLSVVKLLLRMFKKIFDENKCTGIKAEKGTEYVADTNGCTPVEADSILGCLDLDEVKKLKFGISNGFCWNIMRNVVNIETLKVLLVLFPNLEQFCKSRRTYLHVSVQYSRVNFVEYLLRSGANVHQRDTFDNPALHYAAPNLHITRLLIDNKADAYARNWQKENVAHKAISNCGGECSEALINWIAFMLDNHYYSLWSMQDRNKITPLALLLKLVDKTHPAIRLVMSKDTSLRRLPRTWKLKLLEESFVNDPDEEMIELLVELFKRPDRQGRPVMSDIAVTSGANWMYDTNENNCDFRAEAVLCDIDMDESKETLSLLNTQDTKIFVEIQKLESIKVLTEILSDFSNSNKSKWNYIHYAAALGRVDWLDHLIKAGYDINQRDIHGNTPLLCLTTIRPLEVTRILCEKGADMNAVNNNYEQNAAHIVVEQCGSNRLYVVHEWATYMLEKNFLRMWHSKQSNGQTPLQLLLRFSGENHPTVIAVRSYLKKLENE